MNKPKYCMALDQGTSSTRAMIFNAEGNIVSQSQRELTQFYPHDGWVEHDPEEIWQSALTVCQDALAKAGLSAGELSSLGITNQRETIVLWDKNSGQTVQRAIVWQDRRTGVQCQQWQEANEWVNQKTGLLIDPYFSASKIRWSLDNNPVAAQLAKSGQLACGTIDSFLLWRLTSGRAHATDLTNASRTLLLNLQTQEWDPELIEFFGLKEVALPEVKACDAHFGEVDPSYFGAAIPITGMVGDQQSALIGQACFEPGMLKSTYGTGCFLLMNTGQQIPQSRYRLLTTIAYKIQNQVCFGQEGSIFNAGTTVKWLRDELHLIDHAEQTETLAKSIHNTAGVYLVPAFTGLGAPHWIPHARGAIIGLTRDSGIAHITRAALESVCYQTREILDCMQAESATPITTIRVDGGMVVNQWMMQFLSDILSVPVERPRVTETTALGAALLSAIGCGLFSSLKEVASVWQLNQRFTPEMTPTERTALYAGWQQAVQRVKG